MSIPYRFSNCSLFSFALRLLFIGLGLFLCLTAALYYTENDILYRPQSSYTPPGTANAAVGFEEIAVPNVREVFHYGWYAPSTTKKQTLVFFHDGGDTINTTQAFMTPFVLEGYGVLMIEYRGYGEVSGSPEENDIYADTENFFDFLHQVNVNDKQMVLTGQGLGAAVAIEMARRHQAAGLVLVSPFINAISYIRHNTALPRFIPLFKNGYHNLAKIDKIHTPLLILAGSRDTLVPPQDADVLFKRANDPKSLVIAPDASHYDILGRPFATNVIGWLRAQEALQAPQSPQHQLNLNLSEKNGDTPPIEKALIAKPQNEKAAQPQQ